LDSWSFTADNDVYEKLYSEGKIDWVMTAGTCLVNGTMMNANRLPFRDIELRHALNAAVDRAGYIINVHQVPQTASPALIFEPGGFTQRTLQDTVDYVWTVPDTEATQAEGIAGETYKAMSTDPAVVDQNRELSRKLLTAAGYEGGTEIWQMGELSTGYTRGSVYIHDQTSKVGITGELVEYEGPEWDAKLKAGEWLYGNTWMCLTTGDPDELWSSFLVTGGSRNDFGYSNTFVDEGFISQSKDLDAVSRLATNRAMEDQVMADLPFASMAFSQGTKAWWTYVNGIEPVIGFSNYAFNRPASVFMWLEDAPRTTK